MSDRGKKRRPLHFALSGALLVPVSIGAACGPDEAEEPAINVPANDPEPTGNPVGEDPPPELQDTPNPVAEPREPPPTVNLREPPPEPTPNPSGDGVE